MDKFKNELLDSKTVSVWGIGYLGYTKAMRLLSKGFKVNIFDPTNASIGNNFKKNIYPGKQQVYSWTENGHIPPIDMSNVNIANSDTIFNAKIHIIALPTADREGNSLLKELAGIFKKHKKRLKDALVIFESAGMPGSIDKNFIGILHAHKIRCSFVSAFRSDWTLEEFMSRNRKRVLAANDKESLEKAKALYDALGIRYKTLSSIKEAEIYENAKNGFQFIASMFINQLAFAYPDTNIREMTKYLLNDVELNESHLSIGALGYKMLSSVQNIIGGSANPNFLSLLKTAEDSNMSMILTYADIIKNMGCRSVLLMGLSIKGNQKNIELSPSVVLAEYFNRLGIKVYIDDPFYDKAALSRILPFSRNADILKKMPKIDAFFVMTGHNKYKRITQADIKRSPIYNASIIIDNVPIFKEFKFSDSTLYHAIGDGKLKAL
ncbi:MAG: UDP binding domain-containing protein [Candidatus Omnitrophica bacterium]|nr:UDP binding domain-containing protein [Candidatus Omnitrophota bacterium]